MGELLKRSEKVKEQEILSVERIGCGVEMTELLEVSMMSNNPCQQLTRNANVSFIIKSNWFLPTTNENHKAEITALAYTWRVLEQRAQWKYTRILMHEKCERMNMLHFQSICPTNLFYSISFSPFTRLSIA